MLPHPQLRCASDMSRRSHPVHCEAVAAASMLRFCSCPWQYPTHCFLLTLFESCINGKSCYDTHHPSCRWALLCPSAQSISTLKWLYLLSDFIGELEHRFPQSFIVKYSDKADSSSPLQDTEGKLKKNIECKRHLKLTNKWWVELPVRKQSWIIMWCSILKDGSDLKIEIHKTHSWQSKILSLWRTPKSDSPCKTRINFDDLWKHLISEAQKATKCESIFASISPDLLRVLQWTSRWSLIIRLKDYTSGSSQRYAILITANM